MVLLKKAKTKSEMQKYHTLSERVIEVKHSKEGVNRSLSGLFGINENRLFQRLNGSLPFATNLKRVPMFEPYKL